MTDVTTKKPLRVIPNEAAGPFMDVPVSQLDEVRRILDQNKVRYWVDELAYTWKDEPEMTIVYFGREGKAAAVQAILDSHS